METTTLSSEHVPGFGTQDDFLSEHSGFPVSTKKDALDANLSTGDLPYEKGVLRFSPSGSEVVMVYGQDDHIETPTREQIHHALGPNEDDISHREEHKKPSSKLKRFIHGMAFVVAGLIAGNVGYEQSQKEEQIEEQTREDVLFLQKTNSLQADFKEINLQIQEIQSEIKKVKYALAEIEENYSSSEKIYSDGQGVLHPKSPNKKETILSTELSKEQGFGFFGDASKERDLSLQGITEKEIMTLKKIVELEIRLIEERRGVIPDITLPGDRLAKKDPEKAKKLYTEAIQTLKEYRENNYSFIRKDILGEWEITPSKHSIIPSAQAFQDLFSKIPFSEKAKFSLRSTKQGSQVIMKFQDQNGQKRQSYFSVEKIEEYKKRGFDFTKVDGYRKWYNMKMSGSNKRNHA